MPTILASLNYILRFHKGKTHTKAPSLLDQTHHRLVTGGNTTPLLRKRDRHMPPMPSTGNTPTPIQMRSPHTILPRTTYSISNFPPSNQHTRGPNKPAVVRNPVLGTWIHRSDNSTTDIILHHRRFAVLPTPADHRMWTSYIWPNGHIMEPTNTGPATTRPRSKMADICLSLADWIRLPALDRT